MSTYLINSKMSRDQYHMNEYQVRDYNELRRGKSAAVFKRPERAVYDSWGKYEEATMNRPNYLEGGNISYLYRPSTSTASKRVEQFDRPSNLNLVDIYRSADGTVYKHFERGDRSKEVVIDYPTQNIIHIPGKYHEHYRQTVSHNEIPANIKAKFGSRNTRELLKDELKVHDTLSKIYNTGVERKYIKNDEEIAARAKTSRSIDGEENNNEGLSDSVATYYDLSNHLRYTVSRGYPKTVRTSHKEDVHNLELTKMFFSDKDNLDSPYRRKKDWLSKWTEANILRERVFKSLGNFEAEKAKTNNAN